MTHRILITGSRTWTDRDAVALALSAAPHDAVVVHGVGDGGDTIADAVAHAVGLRTEVHRADWRPHGVYNPWAGLARNRLMVELGADVCLAFIRDGSRGATHCANLAEEARQEI